MLYILLWWFILQLFGLAALPTAYHLFRWLPDRGYAFAKALGLLLVSYILWMGAITGVLTNSIGGIVIALLATAGVSGAVLWFGQKRGESPVEIVHFLRGKKATVIATEILFLLAFVAWAVLRAYTTFKVASAGGEKFMETAFLHAILNSPHFPPLDPWLSGFSISYYYFGYVMMAIVTRLSGVPVGVAFDLYDALLFALTALGAYGVVYNLIARSRVSTANSVRSSTDAKPQVSTSSTDTKSRIGETRLHQPIAYGLLASLLTVLMGNLEGLVESLYAAQWLPPSFFEWLNIHGLVQSPPNLGSFYIGNDFSWWWWRGSRVILDRTLAGIPMDSPNITEFPFFSFLLGDNHPHVNNLPFVLLAIGLALNLLHLTLNQATRTLRQGSGQATQDSSPWWHPLAAFQGNWAYFVGYAFCLGALGFLNTWDFPIYIIVTTLAYGVGLYVLRPKLDSDLIGRAAALMVSLLVAGMLLYGLFYVSFQSQAQGFLPYVQPPTRLPQYLVMFGPFVFVALAFLLTALWHNNQQTPGIWRKTLLSWLVVMGTSLGVFFLLMLLLPAITAIRELIQTEIANPGAQQVLGGLTLDKAIPAIILARLTDPWVFLLLTGLITLAAANVRWNATPSEGNASFQPPAGLLFACILLFCGIGLTLSVEFIYLRDGFGNRMNTVFKFYYQAWVMMALACAYAIWWVNEHGSSATGKALKTIFQIVTVLLIAGGMVYPFMASLSKTNQFTSQKIQTGPGEADQIIITPNMDSSSTIARENPADWAAIEWLRANAGTSSHGNTYDVPVILEAPGGSYDYKGRISTFTGLPALLGWAGHELQWRGNYNEQGQREPVIQTIYSTPDPQEALQLLQEWKVDYVIVGATELAYISENCTSNRSACTSENVLRKFDAILDPVYNQNNVVIYRVP
jgi:YYY domain-containing protein